METYFSSPLLLSFGKVTGLLWFGVSHIWGVLQVLGGCQNRPNVLLYRVVGAANFAVVNTIFESHYTNKILSTL